MKFEFPQEKSSIIKVIGVGGGGGNAVNNMFEKGIDGVDFVVANTDIQALRRIEVPSQIRLGATHTQGLGAGANPDVGRQAAVESMEEVREVLGHDTKMVFITAGMGGGTGTGAAPVIANLCKEAGVLTVGIVTTPFKFEGPRRATQADAGLEELRKYVDTLIVIDNNNLQKTLGSTISMRKAFEEADSVLCNAARGIAEIITTEGYINVDFADVCTIMREGGKALMGTAIAQGDNRAINAVEAATNSPLLDNISLKGSRAIIVNITASEDSLGMDETTQIVEHVQETAGNHANIIYGIVYDETMGDDIRVTVIATQFEEAKEEMPQEETFNPAVTTTPATSVASTPAPPKRATLKRLDRSEREKRIKRLNSKQFDIHDPESLTGLENQPAYLRKQVSLEGSAYHRQPELSRYSVEERESINGYELRDDNSFLHDAVD